MTMREVAADTGLISKYQVRPVMVVPDLVPVQNLAATTTMTSSQSGASE